MRIADEEGDMKRLSSEAAALLRGYYGLPNVCELKNAIYSGYIMAADLTPDCHGRCASTVWHRYRKEHRVRSVLVRRRRALGRDPRRDR